MIRCIDARLGLLTLGDGSIDLIVSDPPYPVIGGGNKTKHARCTGILSANNGRIFEHNSIGIEEYAAELYRVLSSPGHAYLMVNLLNLWSFRDELVRVGFKIHNLLIWKKNNVTPNRWYMKNAEYIIFARKGPARTIYDTGAKMILEVNNPTGKKQHPTEKPADLMRQLIENSSLPGETVLDPFMGAGSTGVAAKEAGRRFVGFEIDPEYFRIAKERVS